MCGGVEVEEERREGRKEVLGVAEWREMERMNIERKKAAARR